MLVFVAFGLVLPWDLPSSAQGAGPSLELNPPVGPRGTNISVTGCDWDRPGAVVLRFDEDRVAAAVPDSEDCISASFAVPDTAASGDHRVSGEQNVLGAPPLRVSATFTVTAAGLRVSPPLSPSPSPASQQRAVFIPDPRVPDLERLRADASEPVVVNFVNGFPQSVRTRVEVDGGDPVERALDYLDTYPSLYGIDNRRFSMAPIHRSDVDLDIGVEFVRFQQLVDGVPVLGGQLTTLLKDSEVLATLGQLLTDATALDVQPALGAPAAEAAAIAHLGGADAVILGRTHLRVFDPALLARGPQRMSSRAPTLVWDVTVQSDGREVETLVDTTNGNVLLALSKDPQGFDLDVEDANGQADDKCYYNHPTDEVADEAGVYEEHLSNPEAHAGFGRAGDTYNFYRSRFDRDGYDDNGDEIEVYVDANLSGTVAKFKGGQFCEAFLFRPNWAVTDVFTHEFTHGVDDDESQIKYLHESGAIEESIADVMGALHDGNWTVGEANGNAFRSLMDPPSINNDPDHYSNYVPRPGDAANDFGGVHTNSGILNKAAYLLTIGDTHPNGITVEGIGPDKVGRLMYGALLSLGEAPNFALLRNTVESHVALYSAFGDYGFLPTTFEDDLCSVRNAYGAVGIGAPDIACDGVTDDVDPDDDGDGEPDGEDNCPQTTNPVQSDVDGDKEGDACDLDIDGDKRPNVEDNCPSAVNSNQSDSDGDGKGDACDDDDLDGVPDIKDNCVGVANHDQKDMDGDTRGDACDPDIDNDGVDNVDDNCPQVANPNQVDTDNGGLGDACDSEINNPINDCVELGRCPSGSQIKFVPNAIGRIVIELCGGGCPQDWLDPASRVSIDLGVPAELAPHLRAIIGDVGGSAVDNAEFSRVSQKSGTTNDATVTLSFEPRGLGQYVVHLIADAQAPTVTAPVTYEIRRTAELQPEGVPDALASNLRLVLLALALALAVGMGALLLWLRRR